MARPPGHGPDYEVKRQEIIDIAASLFARNGYAGTGMIELGEAVGLKKGALYYYIESKENLLVQIQERVLDPLVAETIRIEKLDTSPVIRLRLLSERLLEAIFVRLDHIWVYEHDYRHLTGDNLKKMMKRRHQFEEMVQAMLVDAMDDGTFRAMDPTLAMLQYLNLHNHTYQWVRPGRSWGARQLSHTYCRTLFLGFGATPALVDSVESELPAVRRTLKSS